MATSVGVAGWVRNEPDGSVLAVFEGEPDPVERMCRWCRTGPDHARVSRVEVTEEEPEGLTSFKVSF
jgi:acylphosphatase